jgi:hypothetical protein
LIVRVKRCNLPSSRDRSNTSRPSNTLISISFIKEHYKYDAVLYGTVLGERLRHDEIVTPLSLALCFEVQFVPTVIYQFAKCFWSAVVETKAWLLIARNIEPLPGVSVVLSSLSTINVEYSSLVADLTCMKLIMDISSRRSEASNQRSGHSLEEWNK